MLPFDGYVMIWRTVLAITISAALMYYWYFFAASLVVPFNLVYAGLGIALLWTAAAVVCGQGVQALWRRYKILSFLPLCVMLGSCTAQSPAFEAGIRRRATDFLTEISVYESLANNIRSASPDLLERYKKSQPSPDRSIYLATNDEDPLGPHRVVLVEEGDGSKTLRIVMITAMIPTHHRVYMRRGDGKFEHYLEDFERMVTVVNKNWCFVRS